MATRRAGTKSAETRHLGEGDWTGAALDAIALGGLANVSVERLARDLGVSKGSFYWHFADRAALIDATLHRWESDYTSHIIDVLEDEPDPAERFRRLLEGALTQQRGVRVDAALMAGSDDPRVAAALERVTAARLAFVQRIFEELGSEAPADRALLALSAYTGLAQLHRSTPEVVSTTSAASTRFVGRTVAWLLGNSITPTAGKDTGVDGV